MKLHCSSIVSSDLILTVFSGILSRGMGQSKGENGVEDGIVRALRLRHRSYRTEQSYRQWLKRFRAYVGFKEPQSVNQQDLEHFLNHLAVDGRFRRQRSAWLSVPFSSCSAMCWPRRFQALVGYSEELGAESRSRGFLERISRVSEFMGKKSLSLLLPSGHEHGLFLFSQNPGHHGCCQPS